MHPRDYGTKLVGLKPELLIENAYELIITDRMIKSEAEIAAIRQAIRITGLASTNRQARKPALYEHQIEGLFRFAIKDFANAEPAFDTIVASGPNATILHYPNPKDKIADGALVLCDLGARYDGYSADITRTFPASGSFNSLQKEVYEAVLATNKHIITFARPGITLLDLQREAVEFLTNQCMDRGLIASKDQIVQHYYHNVSHHLGLDTHDACLREFLRTRPRHNGRTRSLFFRSRHWDSNRRRRGDHENRNENLSSDIPRKSPTSSVWSSHADFNGSTFSRHDHGVGNHQTLQARAVPGSRPVSFYLGFGWVPCGI
jgi:glycerol-3-phosphate responsive antiterminator